MSNLPDISQMRGLGQPLYFSFNVDPKTKILTSHAVIFGTFILPSNQELKLLNREDDPRFDHFMNYVSQFFDEKTKQSRDELRRLKKDISEIESEISKLKQQLNET